VITVNFKKLNIRPGFKILDVGCGSGRHLGAAYRFKQISVVGADLDHDDVCEARRRLTFHDQIGEHGEGTWALSVADVTCLPFETDYFDLVICSEVMEHVADHQAAAGELVRVLKPGCNLVVSVPRYWPERICWVLSDDYVNSERGHIRIYKSKALLELFYRFGLKKWAVHHAHSLHTPYWWLKCLRGPNRTDSSLVNLYHRLLTWDIMQQPRVTRILDRLLNPVLGKSVVVYFRKE
jgi:SAM-dependent methyltransferase